MNELAYQQSTNGGLRELALFAGAGGGILGGKLLGWRTVCAVEIEPYCRAVLAQRQNDGILAPFPVWDDICTFDGKPWRGRVDVISGGFPCQDISIAGKGKGITGERSGLWGEMFRVVCEVRPRFVFVENSPMLTIRGLGTVLRDLASVGYDARWGVLGADAAGALHHRARFWMVAYPHGIRLESNRPARGIKASRDTVRSGRANKAAISLCEDVQQDNAGPGTRKSKYVAFRVDRLKAIGNGQVPACARLAWEILAATVSKHRKASEPKP